MSYHNGSIWPHDNAIIAAGLARYGFTAAAADPGRHVQRQSVVDLHRLPELICGFHRRQGEGPTLYPVACAPQSWAAGAVFLLLQACLGLRIEGTEGRIAFTRAALPESIQSFQISNLRVGNATVDLRVERHAHDVGVRVMRRAGEVDIITVM